MVSLTVSGFGIESLMKSSIVSPNLELLVPFESHAATGANISLPWKVCPFKGRKKREDVI